MFASNFAAKTVTNVAANFEFEVVYIDNPDSFGKFLVDFDGDFMEKNVDLESDVCSILYSSGTTGE